MGKWSDKAKNAAPPSAGKYIKINDGESAKFILTDQEEGQEITYWLDRRGQREKVTADTQGAERSVKIVLSVLCPDTLKGRVLKLTPNAFLKLGAKVDKYGEDRVYEISREKKKNGFTEYDIVPLDKLTDAQRSALATADLIDVLAENDVEPIAQKAGNQPPAPTPPGRPAAPNTSAPPDGDIPF